MKATKAASSAKSRPTGFKVVGERVFDPEKVYGKK